MPLFIVDTIVTTRMRYVVEAKEATHAEDEVTMIDSSSVEDSFEEFSQRFISENIIDTREITKEEYDRMLVELEESGEGSHWMGDKLIRRIDYSK